MRAAQLLAEVGIDSSVPDPPSALPLELFDNTEYESRPIHEWMAMAEKAPNDEMLFLVRSLSQPLTSHNPTSHPTCHLSEHK